MNFYSQLSILQMGKLRPSKKENYLSSVSRVIFQRASEWTAVLEQKGKRKKFIELEP